MPGKRPRTTMRRTSSVNFIKSGFLTEDCSPLPEHPKEKQKLSNIANPCPATSTIPPRKVIGFSPKIFTEDEHNHLVLPPTSPRPPQVKSNTGSIGSPRSGLGDLLAGSHPWERRDEGVGLGIVTALGAATSEDDISANGVPPPVYAYTTRTSSQHLTSVFVPTNRISPSIPILSPGSNSPSSHQCPSSHRYAQNCAPQFRLSSAMQESMTQSIRSNNHIIGPSGPVNNGGAISSLSAWSQQAENMEVEAIMPVAPSPIISRPSYLPVWSTELSFMDACFYCKRRLEEGRDIYMYRVDKAFCSPECRHKQIVIDERPEKCSQAVKKIEGGTESSRRSGQRSRVAGTAVAA